jgi:hypothetical protein
MIQSKSYGLQNETRQYLRRLYAYGRELNPTDVADIDNFIKGLKQLNLWQNSICFLMRSQHNIGTGNTILSLGGQQNVIGSLVNSPTWGSNGITFSGTNYISALLSKTIQTSEVSMASVAFSDNPMPGFTTGSPYQLYIGGSNFATSGLEIGSSTTNGSTWRVGLRRTGTGLIQTNNPLLNYQSPRFQGARFNTSLNLQHYLNGSTSTNAGVNVTNYGNFSFDRLLVCGRWNNTVECTLGTSGVGFVGTQSFVIVSLDYIDFVSLQRLVKETIGKGLGLP